ncbi:hypothetical protein BD626DRAFT_571290 [Schizophyllum amplum]|uniref:Uncharacterized protein n=1 Tax=Schizophyllum amplum TaxID=97359 RepID=A0A550C7Z4_9AGAR|nr:hypothetical protein BD626DRAFT_571290 [Auriculariopsis ampla]
MPDSPSEVVNGSFVADSPALSRVDDETPDEARSTNNAAATGLALVPWTVARRMAVPTRISHEDDFMDDSVDGNHEADDGADELEVAGHEGDLGVPVEVEIIDDEEMEVQLQVQVQMEDDEETELRERARQADEADMELVEREISFMDSASMLEDDSRRVPRSGATVVDRWSFFRMLFAVHRNLSASFPELIMWGQVFLRCDYRICIYHRAVEDSLRWVIWDPDAPVPWNFYALSREEWLTFALAHSLPAYLQGWRMTRATLGNRVPGETGIITGPRLTLAGQILVDSVTNLTLRELAWTTNGTNVVPEAGRTYSFDDLYPRAGQPHLVDFNTARAAAHESAYRAPPSSPTLAPTIMNSPSRDSGPPGSSTAVGATSSQYSWTSSSEVANWKVGQRLRQPDGAWGPIIRRRLRRRRGSRTPSPTSSALREADNVGSNDEYDSHGLIQEQQDSSSDSLEYASTDVVDDSSHSDSSSSSIATRQPYGAWSSDSEDNDLEDGAPPSAQRPRSEDNVPSSPRSALVLTSSDEEALNGPRGTSPIEVTDDESSGTESSGTPTITRATSVVDLTADTPERGRARIRLMSPIDLVDTPARGRRRVFSPIDFTDEGPLSNRRRLFSPIDFTNEGPPSNRRRMATIELSSDDSLCWTLIRIDPDSCQATARAPACATAGRPGQPGAPPATPPVSETPERRRARQLPLPPAPSGGRFDAPPYLVHL